MANYAAINVLKESRQILVCCACLLNKSAVKSGEGSIPSLSVTEFSYGIHGTKTR